MDMKLLIVLVFGVAISSAIACSSKENHDLRLGAFQYGERILYSTREKESSTILKTKSRDITYPLRGQRAHGQISRIEVLDQMPHGKGGCASLTSGGVGSSFATLHLKTQRGGAFDYLVNIYGY